MVTVQSTEKPQALGVLHDLWLETQPPYHLPK